ncbi:hypothetical protein [Sorangium sp. So ce1078]|uniref:hypothetical protein n=1 Tax=Sorangium sp. So ce1078 TaxID=3133329 RepID=UPI003F63FFCB
MHARESLQATWTGCVETLSTGALSAIEFQSWYRGGGSIDPVRLADALLLEEEQALREGCRALRVSGTPCRVSSGHRRRRRCR